MRDAETLYLDFFNNFLTVAAFADHYGMSISDAQKVIDKGRELHEEKIEKQKLEDRELLEELNR